MADCWVVGRVLSLKEQVVPKEEFGFGCATSYRTEVYRSIGTDTLAESQKQVGTGAM